MSAGICGSPSARHRGSQLYQRGAGGEEVTGAERKDCTCDVGFSSYRARGNGARGVLPANAANLDKPSLESGRKGLQKGQSKVSPPIAPAIAYRCSSASKRVIQSLFPQLPERYQNFFVGSTGAGHIIAMVCDCVSKCMPCPACKGRAPPPALQPTGAAQGSQGFGLGVKPKRKGRMYGKMSHIGLSGSPGL